MKYLVAVSGGVDSVVLLDMLVREKKHDVIVAHFDHGIREDSTDDARFVEKLAKVYSLAFVTSRKELGKNASEETARMWRYNFLREQAKHFHAEIVTAHHKDDLIETIAINIARGTGWRGLNVLSAKDIIRPLLETTKAEIYDYAVENHLEWVEDSSNRSDKFLRNRLRSLTCQLEKAAVDQLRDLWRSQQKLVQQVDQVTAELMTQKGPYLRYFFIMIDQATSQHVLWALVRRDTGVSLTRPQATKALLAVKAAQEHTQYQISSGVILDFTPSHFIVKQS